MRPERLLEIKKHWSSHYPMQECVEEIERLNARMNEIWEEKLKALGFAVDLNATIADLEKQLAEARDSLSESNRRIADLIVTGAVNKGVIESQERLIIALESINQRLTAELTGCQQELTAQSQIASNWNKAAHSWSVRNAELEASLTACQAELEELRKAVSEMQAWAYEDLSGKCRLCGAHRRVAHLDSCAFKLIGEPTKD